MEEQTIDEKELWNILEKALEQAAAAFVETRIKEGENLRKDLIEKLDGMLEHAVYAYSRNVVIKDNYIINCVCSTNNKFRNIIYGIS